MVEIHLDLQVIFPDLLADRVCFVLRVEEDSLEYLEG